MDTKKHNQIYSQPKRYTYPSVDSSKWTQRPRVIIPSSGQISRNQTTANSPMSIRPGDRKSTDKPPPYTDHSFGSILCGICRKGFHPSRPEALLAHLTGHFDMRYDFHRCQRCEINFVREEDLRRHMLSAKRSQKCGFMFEHKHPCMGHHPPRYRSSDMPGTEDRRRYSLMRHSDDARFDFCYRIRNWEQLQLQSFYQKQQPQPQPVLQRNSSKRSKRSSVVDAYRAAFPKRSKSYSSLKSTAPLITQQPANRESISDEITVSNTDVLGAMLLRAVCTGNFELIASLVHAGANVHMEDTFGFGPMHYAARYASCDVVRLLARAGPYINKPDDSNMSPLSHAIKISRPDIAECFLTLGASLTFSHLELAILNSDLDTAEVLLDHWTASQKPLDSLDVLLLTATSNWDRCMVELLLEHGARALSKNGNGNTAMGIAAQAGEREILQLLFDFGGEMEWGSGVQRGLWREVKEFRHVKMVEEMLSKGR